MLDFVRVRVALPVLLSCTLFGHIAAAAEPNARAQVTLVDLSVEASRNAPNDQARATAYLEASDTNAAELAKRVNRAIAAGFDTAKAYPQVKAKSGSTSTWPNYGKNGRSIESWRMRSEIQLESRDIGQLSELLTKLQATLAVSQLTLQPAPETRKKAEDDATLDAMQAFQSKAKLVAGGLGKTYRLRQMSINSSGRIPLYATMKGAPMSMASDAPMPVESGESSITISISGQIELPLD
jgi:predicted secreted protein